MRLFLIPLGVLVGFIFSLPVKESNDLEILKLNRQQQHKIPGRESKLEKKKMYYSYRPSLSATHT